MKAKNLVAQELESKKQKLFGSYRNEFSNVPDSDFSFFLLYPGRYLATKIFLNY